MFDVIPAPRQGKRKAGRTAKPSQHVLKVDWKLPARLRRPIQQQLASERQERRKKILSGFSRRALHTQLLEDVPRQQNMGAEYHTGDVYRETKPRASLVAPPYVGSVVKGVMHEVRDDKRRVVAAASPEVMWPRPLHDPASSGPTAFPASSERVVTPPKRKLALPFSFSVLPKWLMAKTPLRSEETQNYAGLAPVKKKSKEARKKIFNLAILFVGCLVAAGVVANLRSLGQAMRLAGNVREVAAQALGKLSQAQAALAQTDFAGSEAAFTDAAALLEAAQQDLDAAAGEAQTLSRLVDVAGAVQSGRSFVAAGEALTVAGQHSARGLQQLLAGDPTLVDAIRTAREEFAVAVQQLKVAEEALEDVNALLLPNDVRKNLAALTERLPIIRSSLERFVNESDLLLAVLGADRDRDYLVLFANPHELRPVGGFLGSLALLNVNRGAVEEVDVQTVYDGDGQLREFIAPPDPLLPIVNRWYLRDSNWFVDFSVSARKAAQFFEKEGGPTVDGVLLVTPAVIQEWLRLTGPVSVPGYETVVSADNFFEVVQREVTYEYDRELNRPKQFLADLTPLLLRRLFEADGEEALRMLGGLTKSLAQKDLLVYFRDEQVQAKASEMGWTGSLPVAAPGFLMVNNANIGGHKSDQFIEQEIDYRIDVGPDGGAEVVVTIRREHRGPEERADFEYPAGEDPAAKDNVVFQRVLVPVGAELLETQGFSSAGEVPRVVQPEADLALTADADVAEWQRGQVRHPSGTLVGREAGYTFFANWMITQPGQTTVGLYRYRLPQLVEMPGLLNTAARVAAYVAKQPGAARTSVRVSIRLPEGMAMMSTRPHDGVTRVSDRELVYRGEGVRDVVVGAVFEEE